MRSSPDSPAIEKRHARPIETPIIICSPSAETENRRPFNEKRPFLLEVTLDIAQIHDCRIDFDLAEVGKDSPVEGEVASDAEFEVSPESRSISRSRVERIIGLMSRVLGARREVGEYFRLTDGTDIVDSHKVDESGDEAAAILRCEDDVVTFVVTGDVPPEIYSPHVLILLLKP